MPSALPAAGDCSRTNAVAGHPRRHARASSARASASRALRPRRSGITSSSATESAGGALAIDGLRRAHRLRRLISSAVVARDEHRRRRVDRRPDPEVAQRRLGDALEDRRGDGAAVVAVRVRRVDDDDDRERRLARRQEADERRVVVGVRVVAVDQLLGRAGLAGDRVAGDLARPWRCRARRPAP